MLAGSVSLSTAKWAGAVRLLTQINAKFCGWDLLNSLAERKRRHPGFESQKEETLMSRIGSCLTAAFLAGILSSAAIAQTAASPPATKPAPATSATDSSKTSVSTQVENWTKEQWEAAKKEWAKDTTKWANCQKQWNKHKHEGRKSWPSLYKCMTS